MFKLVQKALYGLKYVVEAVFNSLNQLVGAVPACSNSTMLYAICSEGTV